AWRSTTSGRSGARRQSHRHSEPALTGESPTHADHLAAVDHDRGTGDETAGVGAQQQKRTVEIARLTKAAERYVLEDGSATLAREILAVEAGDDPAWCDGVDADTTARELKPERSGELNDRGLRHRIGGHAFGDAKAQDRGDVDDRAALLRRDQPARHL